ncbi:MAG: hypothetical protein CMK89_01525 [Pseudomonadales bacterium]|nr:hypothetical protein [Pseudomonadales bacterium]RLU02845.1 MAG: hypothetical protein D9N11_07150 [Ketobacter sp.]
MKTSELTGRALDYAMYKHACKVSGKAPTDAEFDQGYKSGQFHFHQDKALLLDLVETYKINTQYLAQEWLASTTKASAWGETPLIAVCRLVLALSY